MNFSNLKKALCGLALIGFVTTFGTSCGNTMYGMGLDMERTGRKLQTNHDPNSTGSSYQSGGYQSSGAYQQPQTQQPYASNPYGY